MAIGGTILISDKQGRLRPCLRCGYSLRHIASAKNCPECGLAVRISLSDNRGLEWSNPAWQRFLAVAFGVLGFGLLCRVLSSAADWVLFWAWEDYYQLSDRMFSIVGWISTVPYEISPIACGAALCLLAKGERRHPDRSRSARYLSLGAGVVVLFLGVLGALARYTLRDSVPSWTFTLLWKSISGPWIPLVICVLACAYAHELGKRGGSRRLSKMSQLPLWPAVGGLVIWFFRLDRLFWPLRSIVWEWLFPLSMLAMLGVTVHVLLRGAREAEANWVTDP